MVNAGGLIASSLGGSLKLLGSADLSGGASATLEAAITPTKDTLVAFFSIETTTAVNVTIRCNQSETNGHYDRQMILNTTGYVTAGNAYVLCTDTSVTAAQTRTTGIIIIDNIDSESHSASVLASDQAGVSYSGGFEYTQTAALTHLGFRMASSTMKTTSWIKVYEIG